jgi:NAD(P)-dependent dehydrogenase (short-subunit alcohol dehydrogenase family)
MDPQQKVIVAAPGITDTNGAPIVVSGHAREELVAMLPLVHIGTTDDMYRTCRFHLSDDSARRSGQMQAVDGGRVVGL